MTRVFALIAGLTFIAAAEAQEQAKLGADAKAVVQGNNAFALDLHARLAKEEGNLFFSPYSISNALAMTYAGARGKTAQEMATTLHFDLEPNKLHAAWAELIGSLNRPSKESGYQLSVANRLWGQKDYGFLPEFLKLTKANYGAGLEELDFAKTEAARKTINDWVEKETKKKIKDLIPPDALSADARLVLTNAIYFKASWDKAFEARDTRKADFHVSANKKAKVDMMNAVKELPYFANDQFQMVDLPYENYGLSMLVMVPKKVNGLAEVEKALTAKGLDQWGKLKMHKVTLALPKFKVTSEFKLADVLASLGMKRAFGGGADFSGMTTREKLFIGQVLHKAFVDVHEKGTEAAAATAVIVLKGGPPDYPSATVRADRPFFFVIRENRTGGILFMGRVANPG